MKKDLKAFTIAIATGMFLIGLTTSLSSFTTSASVATDTGTGGTDGTGSEVIDNSVFVGGEDCSTREVIYDFETGKILGYRVFKSEQSKCKSGEVFCFKAWESPCRVISIDIEWSTNQ